MQFLRKPILSPKGMTGLFLATVIVQSAVVTRISVLAVLAVANNFVRYSIRLSIVFEFHTLHQRNIPKGSKKESKR